MPPPLTSPGGAGDMFLMVKGAKFGVIKGESQDAAHPDEIQVLRWSWGMQARPSVSGSGATGRATINDLQIVKKVDSASTALMAALRQNEPIQKAVLTIRKAGESQLEYLKITIEHGRVTSLMVEAGDSGGGSDLRESLSLTFNKVTVEYVPQGKDGRAQGAMTYTDQWNDAQ